MKSLLYNKEVAVSSLTTSYFLRKSIDGLKGVSSLLKPSLSTKILSYYGYLDEAYFVMSSLCRYTYSIFSHHEKSYFLTVKREKREFDQYDRNNRYFSLIVHLDTLEGYQVFLKWVVEICVFHIIHHPKVDSSDFIGKLKEFAVQHCFDGVDILQDDDMLFLLKAISKELHKDEVLASLTFLLCNHIDDRFSSEHFYYIDISKLDVYEGEAGLFMLLIMIKYDYFNSLHPKVKFYCTKPLLGLPCQEFQVLINRNFTWGRFLSSALEEYFPYNKIVMIVSQAKKFFEVYEQFKATTKYLDLSFLESFNPAELGEAFRSNFSFNCEVHELKLELVRNKSQVFSWQVLFSQIFNDAHEPIFPYLKGFWLYSPYTSHFVALFETLKSAEAGKIEETLPDFHSLKLEFLEPAKYGFVNTVDALEMIPVGCKGIKAVDSIVIVIRKQSCYKISFSGKAIFEADYLFEATESSYVFGDIIKVGLPKITNVEEVSYETLGIGSYPHIRRLIVAEKTNMRNIIKPYKLLKF